MNNISGFIATVIIVDSYKTGSSNDMICSPFRYEFPFILRYSRNGKARHIDLHCSNLWILDRLLSSQTFSSAAFTPDTCQYNSLSHGTHYQYVKDRYYVQEYAEERFA